MAPAMIGLVLACVPVAQATLPTDTDAGACVVDKCTSPNTQARAECLESGAQEAERTLDLRVRRVRVLLTTPFDTDPKALRLQGETLARFERAQELWAQFMEADCRSVEASWTTGSGAGGAYSSCRREHAIARERAIWANFLEGTVEEGETPKVLCGLR